jgi:hypothetical protein
MTSIRENEMLEPVAWRWRYVYPDRVGHWTVRQTPVKPFPARPGFAACEVEPLYTADKLESLSERICEWKPIEVAPKDGRSILAIWRWGDNPENGAETHMVVRWCG